MEEILEAMRKRNKLDDFVVRLCASAEKLEKRILEALNRNDEEEGERCARRLEVLQKRFEILIR